MDNLKKVLGFRTNKLWKKIIASLYYFLCFVLVIEAIKDVPEIRASTYDLVIYRTSMILSALSLFIPTLFVSNFSVKEKIPLLKKKKWWSDALGFIIVGFIVLCSSEFISLCHSNDYKQRFEEYSQTEIIYKEHDPDIVPEEEKSSLTEEELNNNLDNIIEDVKEEDSITNDNQNNNAVQNGSEENKVEPPKEENNNTAEKELIKLHYIDVGQGDSIFIELPNKTTMLIDAGESYKAKTVYNYITSLGYSRIDYLVGTHPHTDHIGGLSHIINSFTIGNIYMPKVVHTSKTYENLLNTISEKGLKVTTAKAGVNIFSNESLKIDIIAPNNDSYSNLNNYSAVIKIVYGNKKFLFMGDAETKSENEITTDVSADVIKIGHHGSDTSSGQSFVNRVNAKYVIIMVGENNQYNHPYQTILDRWTNKGAIIYRTDLNGNIVVTSDGNSLDVSSSK